MKMQPRGDLAVIAKRIEMKIQPALAIPKLEMEIKSKPIRFGVKPEQPTCKGRK